MMTEILLRSEKDRNPSPARISTAERGKWGYVTIQAGPHYFQLAGEQADLCKMLHELADSFKVRTVAQVVKSITPEQVIAYFEGSEVLKVHAADVRAVLEPLTGRGRGASQIQVDAEALRLHLSELFNMTTGQWARGYSRRAAAILFGSEDANGGSNLTRIKDAMHRLSKDFTTTTDQAGQDGPETLEKAA